MAAFAARSCCAILNMEQTNLRALIVKSRASARLS